MAQYSTATVEASKLLEAALEQMDGIIQGTRYEPPSNSHHHCLTENDSFNLNFQSNHHHGFSSSSTEGSELSEAMRRMQIAIQNVSLDHQQVVKLSIRDKDVEESILNWIEARRASEGYTNSRHRTNESKNNHEYNHSQMKDRLAQMEDENLGFKEQVTVQNEQIVELEKKLKKVQEQMRNRNDEEQVAVETTADNGCGDALNTSTASAAPSAALQSELIQLKNRCSDLEKQNVELRKVCGGNRTPRYLDLNNPNRRYNNNAQTDANASSPLSSGGISDHEMGSPINDKVLANDLSAVGAGECVTTIISPSPKSAKGLRKIFSKIKRSNSGGTISAENQQNPKQVRSPPPQTMITILPQMHLQEPVHGAFTRGGKFRATTGGHRFPKTQFASASSEAPGARRPFNQWTLDMLSIWMDSLGLGMYDNNLKLSSIRNGEGLASMSSSDLESKLGIKMALHRKKLILAIASRQDSSATSATAENDPSSHHGVAKDIAGKLDHHWVTRWLDDIGLPQYKEAFLEARVDGRVLNVLTVDDLIFELGVGSLLHHLCIRRAIQVLRQKQFDPNSLQRRSSPNENDR